MGTAGATVNLQMDSCTLLKDIGVDISYFYSQQQNVNAYSVAAGNKKTCPASVKNSDLIPWFNLLDFSPDFLLFHVSAYTVLRLGSLDVHPM